MAGNAMIKVMITTAIIAMLGGILLPIFIPLFRTGAENLKVDAYLGANDVDRNSTGSPIGEGLSTLNTTYDTAAELLNYAPLFWVLGMAIVLLVEGFFLITNATKKF